MALARVTSLDDEDVRKIIEAREQTDKPSDGVPLVGYSLEIEKFNQLIDAINLNTFTLRNMFSKKGSTDKFKPEPRPKTTYDKLLEERIDMVEKKDQATTLSDFGF